MNTYSYDVIVVGAGISGLGAALKLKDAGLNVCVLEKESRAGGRVSTDRIDDFVIDRGATLLGGRFRHMKGLIKRLHLEEYAEEIDFSFELHDGKTKKKIRRGRIDDVLFNPKLPWRAKWALLKFGLDILLNGRKLDHGNTMEIERLDDMSVEQYFEKIGGKEVLDHFLFPGLNGPLGGNLRKDSRVILFQTFWNILLMPTWAIRGGMDRITEAMRKELNVRTDSEVMNVSFPIPLEVTGPALSCGNFVNSSGNFVSSSGNFVSSSGNFVSSSGVESQTKSYGNCSVLLSSGEILTCRKVIIALPGHLVPKICNQLPADVLKLLSETTYGTMHNAHVMLSREPETDCAAVGVHESVDCGYEIEVENNRARELCGAGKGLVSVFMWDEKNRTITNKTDDEIKQRAEEIIRARFPECANAIIGTHVIRWKLAIGHLPPGRLTQMCKLRRQMKEWNLPIQLCGDYLDGIASESALATGEEAAENVMRRQAAVGRRELRDN